MNSPIPSAFSPRHLRLAAWLIVALWTLAVTASVVWNARLLHHAMFEAATHDARSGLDKDLLYLMNPAFMTRQVHELKAQEDGVLDHITSLKPLRPENAPDAWEAAALRAFEQGQTEVISREPLHGQRYLRFMKPLVIKAACLECHAGQGHKVGDIGGGITVDLPLDPYLALAQAQLWPIAGVHTGLWGLGVLGIFLGARQLRQRLVERLRAEAELYVQVKLAQFQATIGKLLTESEELPPMLQRCAQSAVDTFDAAFARIWTLNENEQVLELQASAGLYTHLNGPHGRVPVGKFKIGLIAQERKPHLTNQVVGDPRVGDQEWAQREGMVAFAGYPLLVGDRVVGIMALFARHPLTERHLRAIASVSDNVALAIERRRMEEKLCQLSQAVEQSPASIVIADPAGNIEYVNPKFIKVTGYTLAEVLGNNPRVLKSSETSPEAYRELWQTITAGKEWHGEFHNKKKNGELYWESASISPIRDLAGRVTHFVAVKEDITARKQAEEALRRSEAKFRTLYDSTSDAVMLLNEKGFTASLVES